MSSLARLISFIFLINGLCACSESEKAEQSELLRPVKTITIKTTDNHVKRNFPGIVDAVKKAELSFRVDGKLTEFTVREGDRVNKGQMIARLDQTDFSIDLENAQASYDKAKADFSRAEQLINTGNISRAEYDSLKASLDMSHAQLSAAQQNLRYTTLSSPFTGRIAKRFIENHEEVVAKQIIVLLQDTTSFVVKIAVPESVMIKAKRDKSVYTLFASFPDIKNQLFPLTIRETATQANASTLTYTVTFDMSAIKEHAILPGMSVLVHVERPSDNPETVYLPPHTVLEDSAGRFVYVVESTDGQQGIIRRRTVESGHLTEQGMEIISGLNLGDKIVSAGMSKITDGKRIRLSSGE
jgi:RND family efflux transporter MFP subunit